MLQTTTPTRRLHADSAPPAAASRGWRAVVWRAVDTVVAFATLRDVEDLAPLDAPAATGAPVRGARRPEARAAARPYATPERPRFVRPAAPERPRSGRSRVADRPHPHRRPLTRPDRTRRPGAVAAEPQACTTPLPTLHTRTRAGRR
jgi:hypothetical protein